MSGSPRDGFVSGGRLGEELLELLEGMVMLHNGSKLDECVIFKKKSKKRDLFVLSRGGAGPQVEVQNPASAFFVSATPIRDSTK